jgi:hypothetical protein
MKDYDKLLSEANSNRIKTYYNLTELAEITGMCLRALKYRMINVKKKYNDVTMLLNKKNREWQIHYTIIKEFEPRYKVKNSTIYNFNWVSMATWNPKFNYDIKYHVHIVDEVKKQLPNNTIFYAVEVDGRGLNHTHLISDAQTPLLNEVVTSTIRKYIDDEKECQILVELIHNKYSSVEYLRKKPLASAVLQ